MRERIERVLREGREELGTCPSPDALEELRIKYLGRKGLVTELFKGMSSLSAGEKPEYGKLLNKLKNDLTVLFETKLTEFRAEDKGSKRIDVSLPGIRPCKGYKHPLHIVISEICDTFANLGFRVVEGPEIEDEFHNFEALNIPLLHPSRDSFDTFYVEGGDLLRSHTSPMQVRFMEKNKPPFMIIVPGKVFRPDATDASHSFMFHQVEGLAVGENMKFSDLKGVLTLFAKRLFGEDVKMRFRPHFFPFTEPSAEVDISCIMCAGKGCRVCSKKGWLEILGAGMVDPNVFKAIGYDPKKITGFAFGMGVERIAMLKYGIDDIRMFFDNDVRFIKQFE